MEIVRKLKKQLKDRVIEAYLFGSRARGDFKEKSDVDIIIRPKKNFTLLDLVKLKRDLESSLKMEVDISTFEGAKKILPYIKKEMVKII